MGEKDGQKYKCGCLCTGILYSRYTTTLNISYNDFAQKMDMNLDEVTQLILGECELNEEIAKKLEAFFHVEASRWLTLEKQYRMTKK